MSGIVALGFSVGAMRGRLRMLGCTSWRSFSTREPTLDQELARLKIELRLDDQEKVDTSTLYPTESKLPETKYLEDLLSKPDPEFDGILDINNPPKLEHVHYGLLRRILGPKLPRSAEEREREQLQKSDPDNPLYWDEDRWTTMLKAGEELLPLDPYFGFQVLDRTDITVDPTELSKLDQHPEWGPPRTRIRSRYCRMCKPDTTPSLKNTLEYTNVNFLLTFLSAKGMITPRHVNGNCARHQRQLARAVKRARRIGLISPISGWKVPYSFYEKLYGGRPELGDEDEEAEPNPLEGVKPSKKLPVNPYDDTILAKMVGDAADTIDEEEDDSGADMTEEEIPDYYGILMARISGREFASEQQRQQAFDEEMIKMFRENGFDEEAAIALVKEYKVELAQEELESQKTGKEHLAELGMGQLPEGVDESEYAEEGLEEDEDADAHDARDKERR
eukprot:gb/GEZN01007686.1/.p1 GENE.gb/GEZN01007686.1/~~gb/GEZN01007686.1/.p1  ORF type:complete len:481 (-),score=76.22 gb/GEZN01007686.1/:72-1415(-)